MRPFNTARMQIVRLSRSAGVWPLRYLTTGR